MKKIDKKKVKKKIEEGSIYTEYKYVRWRKRVFKRDGYGCQFANCKYPTGKLNAHHVKMKWYHPELMYDIKNGITLCEYHHKYIHRQGCKKYEKKFSVIIEKNSKKPIIRKKRYGKKIKSKVKKERIGDRDGGKIKKRHSK